MFSNASTGNMGKLFLDQSDHFGIALVKLQSYVQPHLFVRETWLSVSNPYGHLLASPSQHRRASSYLLCGGHRFLATFVFNCDFELFHPNHLHLTVPQYTRIFRMDKLPRFCVIDECLRALQKHRENIKKFGSCPVRSKTLVFPGFFAFLANCFGRL